MECLRPLLSVCTVGLWYDIENCIVGRSGAKGRVAETCPARPKSPEGEYQGDSAIGEKRECV